MTLGQFIDKYTGVHVDEDGYYGAQCWDISARYAREVVGCPSFPTGSGGAEGLFRIFANPIPQYFDRIANNKNDPNQLPQAGDVIVWDASFSPPWGHTAVCIYADRNGVTVLEQNGNNPSGVAYRKTRGWTGVSGWLRPKVRNNNNTGGSNVSVTDLNIARILSYHILGRVDGGNNALAGQSDGDLNKNHVGQETNAKIWAFYNSDEGKNWRERRLANLLNAEARANQIGSALTEANNTIARLQTQIQELGSRPTQADLDKLNEAIQEANKQAMAKQAELEKLQSQNETDKQSADTLLRRLGQWLSKYLPTINK